MALSVEERYKYLVYCLANDNQQRFAEKTGISKITINKIIHGAYPAKEIGKRIVNMICAAYPEINRVWLETGEGEPGVSNSSDIIKMHKEELAKKDAQIEELIAQLALQRKIIEKLMR